MEEGIVHRQYEYFKYGDNGESVLISEPEYNTLMDNYDEFEDPMTGPPCWFETYDTIRLKHDTIIGIIGVLTYDMGLNKFAVENGYHPASGFKKCSAHEGNVIRREKQIKLLGGNPIDYCPSGLYTERCESCRK